jgi:bifunctional DNA-binding transcriptional regulator/antitoxin component of YhaV-PrlF toxin-antitoxin module
MLKFRETNTRKFVRVREKNQITLPAEILANLPVAVGDFLEINLTEQGLELKPTRLVTVGTPAAAREHRAAEQQIPARGTRSVMKERDLDDILTEKLGKKRRAVPMAGD